uniref:Uncharacterized protein n=1 Tax=Sphaerodactylus townsendi TaxID=933632 RepID=A0ACB8EE30_9SAUR
MFPGATNEKKARFCKKHKSEFSVVYGIAKSKQILRQYQRPAFLDILKGCFCLLYAWVTHEVLFCSWIPYLHVIKQVSSGLALVWGEPEIRDILLRVTVSLQFLLELSWLDLRVKIWPSWLTSGECRVTHPILSTAAKFCAAPPSPISVAF